MKFKTLFRVINRFLPPLIFIIIIYIIGWVIARPIGLIFPNLSTAHIDLIGTFITFLLFLTTLPSWIKRRWRSVSPVQALGLQRHRVFINLLKGTFWAFLLLVSLIIPLSAGGLTTSNPDISGRQIIDAIFLFLFVGFAEELVFRAWLWGELKNFIGSDWSFIVQAAIFSLVHTRFNIGIGWSAQLLLLLGLFLLGLLLGLRRIFDNGSLWGCMALHGGLVSGWFVFSKVFFNLSDSAPIWLIGPGGHQSNPLGGAVAIIILVGMLFVQLKALPISLRPFNGARRASSNGAFP